MILFSQCDQSRNKQTLESLCIDRVTAVINTVRQRQSHDTLLLMLPQEKKSFCQQCITFCDAKMENWGGNCVWVSLKEGMWTFYWNCSFWPWTRLECFQCSPMELTLTLAPSILLAAPLGHLAMPPRTWEALTSYFWVEKNDCISFSAESMLTHN